MSTHDAGGEDDSTSGFVAAMGRLLDRAVGGLTGERGRAAAAAQTFMMFSAALSLGYAAFYLSYPDSDLRPLAAYSVVCAIAYVVGVVTVRIGYQLAASIIGLTVATSQVVFIVSSVGWESGAHMYLIVGGQLVYMVFTERQRLLRWAYLGVAATAFVVCQVALPATGGRYVIDGSTLTWMFSINAVLAMTLLFTLAALAHFRARESRAQAAESAERAEYLANTDALTGLSNRRPILEVLERVSSRSVGKYCVAIADLDRFKDLNDTYGHSCGDAVLAVVGDRLRADIRTTDALGRWGGEEFIFVMTDTSLDAAVRTMDRTRNAVSGTPVPCSDHEHHVTVSIGVAGASAAARPHLVIKDADDALYEAKLDGRDCVRVHRGAGVQMSVMAEADDEADKGAPGASGRLG
ncbi:GGDEF domain-containing protein [Demequina aurantiaca]|uniref:GGDEF domain-containing protein n=1 Tax=Demequina aurantiaca TaxID=676200 RepID=UPI0007807637|nr:GGDEF domain-containing protein [Demequina aurantiaca]